MARRRVGRPLPRGFSGPSGRPLYHPKASKSGTKKKKHGFWLLDAFRSISLHKRAIRSFYEPVFERKQTSGEVLDVPATLEAVDEGLRTLFDLLFGLNMALRGALEPENVQLLEEIHLKTIENVTKSTVKQHKHPSTSSGRPIRPARPALR